MSPLKELPAERGSALVIAGARQSSGAVPILRQAGHSVSIADDEAAALALLERRSFDALVCELGPPPVFPAFLDTVQKRHPAPRVVAVGVPERHADLLGALRHGDFAYLEAPFAPTDLALAVERAMAAQHAAGARAVHQARWRRLESALRRMNGAGDRADLLAIIGQELPNLLDGERCSIYAYEEGCLTLAVSTREVRGEAVRLPLVGAPFGELALRDLPIMLKGGDRGALSSLLVPGFVQDELVAVMVVEREPSEPSAFDDEDVQFHQAVVANVGSALRVRDRTAALENALRDLHEVQGELLRMERVAAVGKLAFDISHELKNRLTSMTFAVQNVRDAVGGPLPDAPALKSLALLDDDIRRMRDRVEAFYAMARGGRGRDEECRVDELVAQVVERFRAEPRAAGVHFREAYGAAVRVRADREELFSAVSNLVVNAIDALAHTPGPQVAVSVTAADKRVRITVGDNGPGVPPEIRERIFDAFYGTKPHGTGLGLSQVFVFAEQSGGRVYLADAPHGARFVIELPEAT
ncbi:MAG TPA: GAF domain-containing sensor histidine kinase [Polyangia bacterium]